VSELDREGVVAELDRVRRDFRLLLDSAEAADLRRRSNGTRWTNRQLLFHMLFGGPSPTPPTDCPRRSPAVWTRWPARSMFVNYLGSLGGGRFLGRTGMAWLMDVVATRLQKSIRRAPESALNAGMHFPVRWDPYFNDYMTVLNVYHYGTQRYDHHRRQLTLTSPRPRPGAGISF
jgi:hypothetical protein